MPPWPSGPAKDNPAAGAADAAAPSPRKRKKPDQPEHRLQRAICDFNKVAIAADFEFLSFDRGPPDEDEDGDGFDYRHYWEAARGIREGTGDSLLMVAGFPGIWWELKVGSRKPTPKQFKFGDAVTRVGRIWRWANCVRGYAEELARLGVPLRPHAMLIAEDMDLRLEAPQIRKQWEKKMERRQKKLPLSTIQRVERIRARTRF